MWCPKCGNENPFCCRVPEDCLFCSKKVQEFNYFMRSLKKEKRIKGEQVKGGGELSKRGKISVKEARKVLKICTERP